MSLVAAILAVLAIRQASGLPACAEPPTANREGSYNVVLGSSSRPVIALDDAGPSSPPSAAGTGAAAGGGAVNSGAAGGGRPATGEDATEAADAGSTPNQTEGGTSSPAAPTGSNTGPILLHHQTYPSSDGAQLRLGTEYILVYQSWDQQSFQTHRVDVDAVLRRLHQQLDPASRAFVQLDYEGEFLEALMSDPALPRFQNMLQHLCDVLDQIRVEFPSLRLSYYRLPDLPAYPASSTGEVRPWASASEATREREIRRVEALQPLLDRMDWFAPNLYDWLENQDSIDRYGERAIELEHSWRRDQVKLMIDYVARSSRPDRLVLPMVCTMWVYRSSRSASIRDRLIPVEEFVTDQVNPALANSAAGLTFWNNDRNMVEGAFGVITYFPPATVERYRQAMTFRNGGVPFNWNSELDRARAHRLVRDQELERVEVARRLFLDQSSGN